MPRLSRRALLLTPLLAAPAVRATTWHNIPPFRDWVGKTALLRGDGGAARLLLSEDGTGMMAVRFIFFCRALPILSWRFGPDPHAVAYRRVSAIDANRVITGEARILAEERQVVWLEAARHTAEFEGFASPDVARVCG
jgi:hypothetical protein